MRNKIALILIVSLSLGLVLAGCGTKKADNNNSATTDPDNNNPNNMVNPLVEIEDASLFETDLGISIDTSILSEDATLYIINDSVASVEFVVTNVNGEDCIITLRATKDTSIENLSGVEDDNMDEPWDNELTFGDNQITLTCTYAKTEQITIYTWSYNEANYSITFPDGFSQMTIAATLDRVFVAIGADTMN